ncbi:MAG TPA: hypothetical protein VHM31_20805 [Polyangia bacterium]|nr:hypothetical protein [Polyangia bacterium]
MPAPARSVLLLVALLTGPAIGCSSSSARDQNYGTNLGADFVAPVVDAGHDAAPDGASGGSGGAASPGTGGSSGAAGAAGAGGADVTGVAGADGSAGAAGTGS